MKDVFVVADNIVSPLGRTTAENFSLLREGIAGVRHQNRPEMSDQPFYAALFDRDEFRENGRHTKFEQLLIASIGEVLVDAGVDPADPGTILILSTTKGNIGLLEEGIEDPARISLTGSARLLAHYFGFVHSPVVVSNACISGILALVNGMRLIRSGRYETAVVAGADLISKFVLSGFGSFQAISAGYCKPFDQARDGINLGEGAGAIVLSGNQRYRGRLRLRGGSVGNDANHISGPSRTGEELAHVITRSLADAGCGPAKIDFISAHGTATLYNDEMEARAITLARVQGAQVNSLKGYYGHTLGAAGLIESIVTLESMREDLVLPSPGYETNGVSTPLNVCTSLLSAPLEHCLKTASGFGGCNAAIVMSK
ncbi:MAG TPA: beta-ketoacyl synthase N-terminal-like domain-containing protein [Puia sp.]|jgi:3-oxoacyl-[acyl-carrier-protein] synthase-1|nr:beta-ketoacyl synthase N-terminal-like domain-containing protein [Puia sp.]